MTAEVAAKSWAPGRAHSHRGLARELGHAWQPLGGWIAECLEHNIRGRGVLRARNTLKATVLRDEYAFIRSCRLRT